MNSDSNWRWFSFGKHPGVKDYFRIGQSSALVNGFSDWVEAGYQLYGSKRKNPTELCSWRFWSRGFERENLSCGLVRDSADRVGRPYPLFIMGTGPLKSWEEQWDLLPYACERTWAQMETISAKMFSDFKKLEAELHSINHPLLDWPAFFMERERLREFLSASNPSPSKEVGTLEREVSNLSERAEIFICLDSGALNDRVSLMDLCHHLLKEKTRLAPNAIFMGGSSRKSYFAVFRRPLSRDDFIRLWSACTAEGNENGSRTAG